MLMPIRLRLRTLTTHLLSLALCAGTAAQAVPAFTGPDGDSYPLTVQSLQEQRWRSTVRQQFDFSCGSAALATLLSYHYGRPVGERTVFEEMFRLGDAARIRREGFSLLDMKTYLQSHGLTADAFQLPLQRLLEASRPAIVLLNEQGYHHFVVVKGLREGRVLLGDPSSGTRALPVARFEAGWVNRLLFVVHTPATPARFNEPADWLDAPPAPLRAGLDTTTLHTAWPGRFGPGGP